MCYSAEASERNACQPMLVHTCVAHLPEDILSKTCYALFYLTFAIFDLTCLVSFDMLVRAQLLNYTCHPP